ncbi:MAG: UDP-N-acetylmuramate dehydrogenase [Guyparkeria sp.]|uniref:UDP-N-acetylmuramate dehydrogenase n=1 Tax=Guyparkeria sp. TaxID=2035736 RepID=UPI003979EBE6
MSRTDRPSGPAGPVPYEWREDVPVENTLRLPARAGRELVMLDTAPSVFSDPEVGQWLADPAVQVIGGGSNLVFVAPVVGRAVRVAASRSWMTAKAVSAVKVVVEAGKGLDELVRETAVEGWYGLEALAEIPGTVGAAPVQNVGAYGTEIGERVVWVEAYDRLEGRLRRLSAEECAFGYRSSRFKRETGRWLITRVALSLSRERPDGWPPATYPGVADALADWAARNGREPESITPLEYAEIITRIRRRKLPDWRRGWPGSVGSFFQNPVVSVQRAAELRRRWPAMPQFELCGGDGVKLSAGWLIEQAGWKGQREGNVGVSPEHALVLLHHGGASGEEFWSLARRVRDAVAATFGVTLQAEPRIIGVDATE